MRSREVIKCGNWYICVIFASKKK